MRENPVWYKYVVQGTLEKTPPNQSPTQFLVRGESWEKFNNDPRRWKTTVRRDRGEVLISAHLNLDSFLESIPLGAAVIFGEAAKRIDGKMFAKSYSIEVVMKKKKVAGRKKEVK